MENNNTNSDYLIPKFGDLVENGWAGENNPNRVGIFVRRYRRTGRLNPGDTWVLTDGKGKFWEHIKNTDHKLSIIGTVFDQSNRAFAVGVLKRVKEQMHQDIMEVTDIIPTDIDDFIAELEAGGKE